MDGNHKEYNHRLSQARIDEILNQPAGQFDEVEQLPKRDQLTFTNGFYAHCSAIFVDIRDSSGLTTKYTRPVLAKIYRVFISEMVAVLNSMQRVREVNIVGDCVWAVYNTPQKTDIDEVFHVAYTANTLQRLINCRLAKKGYETPLKFGLGIDYGRALMIKAGYKGSAINDVIYMGDVVNHASHLAHNAGRRWNDPIWVGETFAQNLNGHNQGLLSQSVHSYEVGWYRSGSVIHTGMNAFVDAICD